MAVRIEPVEQNESYKVNEHFVYKDGLDNWTCKTELSDMEMKAFQLYQRAIIDNVEVKKHLASTYKGN